MLVIVSARCHNRFDGSFCKRGGPRIKVADLIQLLLEQIAREKRHCNLVLLFLERSEVRTDFDRFVGLQKCSRWIEGHLALVLLRNAPLILYWNPRVILDLELLLGLHTHVGGREEQLVLLEADRRRVAEALKGHLLHVRGRVVEDELS